MFYNETIIANIPVSFTVDEGLQVSFKVNNSYERKSKDVPKVAIVKWLLEQFRIVKEEYTYLYCKAWVCEDQVDRVKIYRKVGFTQMPDKGPLYLEWGQRPPETDSVIEDMETLFYDDTEETEEFPLPEGLQPFLDSLPTTRVVGNLTRHSRASARRVGDACEHLLDRYNVSRRMIAAYALYLGYKEEYVHIWYTKDM